MIELEGKNEYELKQLQLDPRDHEFTRWLAYRALIWFKANREDSWKKWFNDMEYEDWMDKALEYEGLSTAPEDYGEYQSRVISKEVHEAWNYMMYKIQFYNNILVGTPYDDHIYVEVYDNQQAMEAFVEFREYAFLMMK